MQLPAFFVNADSNPEVITASHRRLLELFESKITVRFRDAAGKGLRFASMFLRPCNVLRLHMLVLLVAAPNDVADVMHVAGLMLRHPVGHCAFVRFTPTFMLHESPLSLCGNY